MMTRAPGIGFLLATLLMGRVAQAQCANSPSAGPNDTCFGTNAMSHDTTGAFNTAIGFGSLAGNSSGNDNVAVGNVAASSITSGSQNTTVGSVALIFNAVGSGNTAVGYSALRSSQTSNNTAVGSSALYSNTYGDTNTASGASALWSNTSGYYNVAFGAYGLYFNTTGLYNTAVGSSALQNLGSGNYNVALGVWAGYNYSGQETYNILVGNYGVAGENFVTRIGSAQTKAFVAGIYGATSSSGAYVFVNSNGQLGTTTSSLRFKEDVVDMGDAGTGLMRLRPVTFHYKAAYDDGTHLLQYGLIAEEVAKVYPDLVQYDETGQPVAVRYHFVNAMLLDEVQKQHRKIEAQQTDIAGQRTEIASQRAEIAGQQARIDNLEARLARLEAFGTAAPRP